MKFFLNNKPFHLYTFASINLIKKEAFTLEDVYKFEDKLKLKYSDNNFIKNKIRPQIQVLLDKRIIEFVDRD